LTKTLVANQTPTGSLVRLRGSQKDIRRKTYIALNRYRGSALITIGASGD